MYHRELVKSKTAAKVITHDRKRLKQVILSTLYEASKLVGDTLGPNGRVALLERQESLPPFATKDGITVFNSMAFSDPTIQVILEAARDSSSKTNVEAGDGTTTATILAESLIRLGFEYLEKNPRLSVQKVVRELEGAFRDIIKPFIEKNAVKINDSNSKDLLRKVAMIATNNDDEMSDAVIEAFDLVGHNGNITIEEQDGSSGFQVERIEGLPIARGFEDSCGRFLEEFINDKGNYRTILDKPRFILYNGKLNEITALIPILTKVSEATGLTDAPVQGEKSSPNVVIMAHHFSEAVLAFLGRNFKNAETLNMIPLRTPMNEIANSQHHFLLDVGAFVGAEVFDPLTKPLETAEVHELGLNTIKHFEYYRYKSMILGDPDEARVVLRVEELEQQAKQAESIKDAEILRERMSLLTMGLARVKVLGSSEAELKEKRHRVEDAVCAVKGALKEGVLPGCGKTLLTLSYALKNMEVSESVKEILASAFTEPFHRILANGWMPNEEISSVYKKMMDEKKPFFNTYDALNHKHGDALKMGVIDSASAVLMAIKNSLAVAKMLMGLSGIVVFKRDLDTDIGDAKSFDSENTAIQEAIRESDREKWEVPI